MTMKACMIEVPNEPKPWKPRIDLGTVADIVPIASNYLKYRWFNHSYTSSVVLESNRHLSDSAVTIEFFCNRARVFHLHPLLTAPRVGVAESYRETTTIRLSSLKAQRLAHARLWRNIELLSKYIYRRNSV